MISSSHQALGWNLMVTCLSYCICSAKEMRFPFPQNRNRGFTLGSPSEKGVSWTVHCRLSSPEVHVPPHTHTERSPVSAYVSPSQKLKAVQGVWSILAILPNLLSFLSNSADGAMKLLNRTALVFRLLLACVGCASHVYMIPLLEALKPSLQVAETSFWLQLSRNLFGTCARVPTLHLESFLQEFFVLIEQLLFHLWMLCSPPKFHLLASLLAASDLYL